MISGRFRIVFIVWLFFFRTVPDSTLGDFPNLRALITARDNMKNIHSYAIQLIFLGNKYEKHTYDIEGQN